MALGAEPRGAGPLACTIHIWPSRELVAQSWDWPASWHEAFERAVGLLGLAAAICVLDGRPFSERQFELPISVGCLKFSVARKGETILITISDFTGPDSPGPDSPGPNGGARQPSSIDGLVLGLRGSGKNYRLVVFHGFMPPIPTINVLASEFSEPLFGKTQRRDFIVDINKTAFSISRAQVDMRSIFAGSISIAHRQDMGGAAANAASRGWVWRKSNSRQPASMPSEFLSNECHVGIVRMHELLRLPNHQEWQHFPSRGLCGRCRQMPGQSQFSALPGPYLH